MNKNTLLVTIAAVGFLFGFISLAYIVTTRPAQQQAPSPQLFAVKPSDHVKWSPQKKHVLIEYADLQCPACRSYHGLLQQVEASDSPDLEITKKVTLVWRHFPLIQIHPNALAAAYAAEAAQKQGKFFLMVDLLYANQDTWASKGNPQDVFVGMAKKLGLNLQEFQKDINSQEIKDRVQADFAAAAEAGVNSTPTFFLDGKKLDNIRSFTELTNLLKSLE